MSYYTTELRYICEHYAGLDKSTGYSGVDDVIQKSIPNIFDFDFPIFDEAYRNILETKILRHYYTREIGLETVALWKLKLQTKLNEIMPFYNQLYKSEVIEFNPLYDVDVTRTRKITDNGIKDTDHGENRNDTSNTNTSMSVDSSHEEDVNINEHGSEGSSATGSSLVNNNNTETGSSKKLFSDTPQGSVTDLESGRYMTNATIDSATNTTSGSTNDSNTLTNDLTNSRNTDTSTSGSSESYTDSDVNNTTTSKANGYNYTTMTNTSDYTEHVLGSNGGESFSKRLLDFRNTFINIDMQIIDELSELFLNLWI